MKLSKKSLEILNALFSEESQLQFPAALAENVIEIRNWIKEQLKEEEEEKK